MSTLALTFIIIYKTTPFIHIPIMFSILLGLLQDELVKKLGSLHTYYGKEVGKERNSRVSGTGRKDVYTSKWPFFNSLHFLKDNITPQKTTSNIDAIVITDEQSETSTTNNDDQAENTPPVVENCVFKLHNPPASKGKKKKSTDLEEELLSTCIQELKKPQVCPDPQDADMAFGNYIVKQLKNIPNGYPKEMMKIEIQQVIMKTMVTGSTIDLKDFL